MAGEPDRLAHPQGGVRPGPEHFGPDHYAEPVTDDANHVAEMNTDHEGRPTIREQRARQGMA
jgi:hypothetical protein